MAPELARPLPVIADAQIELGRYPGAARTIQRLVDLKPGPRPTRASRTTESCTATPAARCARCGSRSRPAAAPEGPAYVETLLGDLQLTRGRAGAARTPIGGALRD